MTISLSLGPAIAFLVFALASETKEGLMFHSHSPTPATRVRVLVVDDNIDAADSLATLLKAWGYDSQVAYNGVTGLRRALAVPPAAILSDIGLPDMNGYDFARYLRQQGALQQTVLVAISGYGNKETRALAAAAGFDYHYTKPVDLDTLQRLLHSVSKYETSTRWLIETHQGGQRKGARRV